MNILCGRSSMTKKMACCSTSAEVSRVADLMLQMPPCYDDTTTLYLPPVRGRGHTFSVTDNFHYAWIRFVDRMLCRFVQEETSDDSDDSGDSVPDFPETNF